MQLKDINKLFINCRHAYTPIKADPPHLSSSHFCHRSAACLSVDRQNCALLYTYQYQNNSTHRRTGFFVDRALHAKSKSRVVNIYSMCTSQLCYMCRYASCININTQVISVVLVVVRCGGACAFDLCVSVLRECVAARDWTNELSSLNLPNTHAHAGRRCSKPACLW